MNRTTSVQWLRHLPGTALLSELWWSRGFIAENVRRGISARYRSSSLGAVWLLIQPLAMIAVYALVFSELMRARMPGQASAQAYGLYLCTGMLFWGLFAEILQRSLTLFLEFSSVIKKQKISFYTFPAIVSVTAAVNFALGGALLMGYGIVAGAFPGTSALCLPLIALALIGLAQSLGLILGVVNVFVRDVGQVMVIVIQFWFWLTPVVYVPDILPQAMQSLLWINPVAPLVGAAQRVMLTGQWPSAAAFLPALGVTALALTTSRWINRRTFVHLVDEL